MSSVLPSVAALKDQAKRLRTSLENSGQTIGHSQALELLAGQFGFRDWNTLRAKAQTNGPAVPVTTGQSVSGEYLGQPFEGKVLSVGEMSTPDRFRIAIRFNQPVDVVTFDSFSAYRHRVNCVIDASGISPQKTSNGTPHLRLAM